MESRFLLESCLLIHAPSPLGQQRFNVRHLLRADECRSRPRQNQIPIGVIFCTLFCYYELPK